MSNQVEIITDETGNKKSVIVPYALYEALITALATRDEANEKVMKIISAMVEAQTVRVESQQPARVAPPPPLPAEAPVRPQSSAMLRRPELPDEGLGLTEAPNDPKQDIRSYMRARGYFTETGGFWILAGSIARFNVSNAFEAVEALVTLRRKLVEEGVLASDPNYPDLIFTRDCYFNSASTAACIVDGNARNNPTVWRKK